MVGFKQTLCVLLLAIFPVVAMAQNNTNSPYTRYGYGQLSDQTFGNSKAMGGIAYGLRDGSQINPLNPASYTAIDSLTFIFEGGFSVQNTNFSAGNSNTKLNAKNSSFDYVAMQFRMKKWMAMSIGLLPYSNVGYSLSKIDVNTPTTESQNVISFAGEGGLHQLYVGMGFKVLKNLSVGANISYFWGDITRQTSVVFPNDASTFAYTELTNVSVRDYKLDLGAQYTHQFSKKHSATIGVVFTPGHDLNNDAYLQTQTVQTGQTTEVFGSYTSKRDTVATFGTPNVFGIGLTYNYDNRLTVGLDYSLQKWGSVSYMNDRNAFCDASKIALGAEFLPSMTSRYYLAHVKYRIGAYYSLPYYKIKNEAGNFVRATREYGVTAGFGLPLPRSRSLVSVTAQYIKVKGQERNFVDEGTFRLSIGLTFNERWFFKRKVD